MGKIIAAVITLAGLAGPAMAEQNGIPTQAENDTYIKPAAFRVFACAYQRAAQYRKVEAVNVAYVARLAASGCSAEKQAVYQQLHALGTNAAYIIAFAKSLDQGAEDAAAEQLLRRK